MAKITANCDFRHYGRGARFKSCANCAAKKMCDESARCFQVNMSRESEADFMMQDYAYHKFLELKKVDVEKRDREFFSQKEALVIFAEMIVFDPDFIEIEINRPCFSLAALGKDKDITRQAVSQLLKRRFARYENAKKIDSILLNRINKKKINC